MKRSNILEARRARVSQESRDIVDFSFRISDRIYEVLASKGLTQKDLARMLGKNESEISKRMRGTHNFTIGTLLSIERVLGEPIVEVSKKNKEESTFVPVPLLFPVGKKVYPTDFVYSDNCDYAVVKPASKLSIKIKC